MQGGLQDTFLAFADRQAQKEVSVLVLGAGVIGARHIASLNEVSAKILQPRYGVTLNITAVEMDDKKRASLPDGVNSFAQLDYALSVCKPDVVLMAFNDDQHIGAFRTIFARCPDVKAILTEKPLTVLLSEAHEIEKELRQRYLSMNTVINFSPVFERLGDVLPSGLTPIGFEAIWGKNRTTDTRPSIGVPSESVHALSVVSDMFGQRSLMLETGDVKKGYLSTKAQDVVYEMDALFRSAETGLPMRFHASYVFQEQHRTVTAFYAAQDGRTIAAEMDFDIKVGGKNTDRLRLHEIDQQGHLKTIFEECPEVINNGAPAGVLKNDRIMAFISLSMQDFLTPAQKRQPDLYQKLSNLDAALQAQGEVEQINADNPRLSVSLVDADPANLGTPKYTTLVDATPQQRQDRIAALKPQVQTRKPAVLLKSRQI